MVVWLIANCEQLEGLLESLQDLGICFSLLSVFYYNLNN